MTSLLNWALVIASVGCTLCFSYLPFLFFAQYIGVEKVVWFVFFGVLALALALRKAWTAGAASGLNKQSVFVIGLYTLFATYAFASFALTDNVLDDTLNIIAVTLINTMIAVLAVSCKNFKHSVLKLLFVLSSVYFLFLVLSFLQGTLSVDSQIFQNIFPELSLEYTPYQNINTYLGLFIITCVYFYGNSNRRNLLLPLMGLLAFMGMFIIGGRSSVVASVIALTLHGIVRFKNDKSRRVKMLLFFVFLAACFFVYFGDIAGFFQNTVLYDRFNRLSTDDDSSERAFLFGKAIELFLRDTETFFVGAGINSFPAYVGKYEIGYYPHNIVLELLAEYGLCGFALFMAPVVQILRLRKKRLGTIYGVSNGEVAAFTLATYYWVISSFTGGLQSSWILIFFTFLLLPSASEEN